jgi:thymidylate synthase (FAD)
MPTAVPIEFFRIGKTQVDEKEVQRWLDFVGVTDPVAFLADALEQGVTNPALNIALAGKRCYKSFEAGLNPNVTRIRERYAAYFDNILASGHGSVLEHSVYTYAIENVSRVFTAEMNRHRAGWAISEGSLRFIRFGENIPYWQPDSISGPDVLGENTVREIKEVHHSIVANRVAGDLIHLESLDHKKHATRLVLAEAFGEQQDSYRLLETIWADELAPTSTFQGKKEITSMMRRIVGLGVATGGVWTGNVRALRHVITMRASPQAEEEMLHVWSRIAADLAKREPMLFGDFTQTDGGYWVPKYVKV